MGKKTKSRLPVLEPEVGACDPEVESLERLYAFRKREEVVQYLARHRFLGPLLREAHGKIAEYFGPSPEVVLEVVTDPEAEDDRELFAFIRTPLPPEEALRELERLDQEWWLGEADQADGKLCIHVECQ
jgi:uncharacterized protein (DUF1810 family)